MPGAAGGGGGQDEATRRRTLGGLPWIVVYVDHLRHPKAVELAHELKDPRAALHLVAVWCYFAEHWPEGTMPARPALVAALEAAALWQGESGVLVTAMLRVGFLERHRGRLAVHDWDVYQRAHVERRARDRAYQRRRRARANDEFKSSSPQKEPPKSPKSAEANEKPRPDVGTTSPFASPSPSPSPSVSRSQASDGTRSLPVQTAPPTNGALSTSASQVFGYLQKHRSGRQLIDISDDLGVSVKAAEGAARELITRQLAEWVQLGHPPIATLRLAP